MHQTSRRARTTSGVESVFLSTLERHAMIRPGDRVLAGVSGGGDSVLLLHLLVRHRARCPFTPHVAHLNHALRGAESEADEAFVRAVASRFSLPVACSRADLSRAPGDPSSLEERARIARRAFLLGAAAEAACNRIALGHTLDDQVETILMWLLRGTGRGGLSGMEPVTAEGIIRPLIGVRRSEVREHLAACGEAYRDDASNEDPAPLRNRIRSRLVPIIEFEFPGSVPILAAEAAILAAEETYLDEAAGALLSGDPESVPAGLASSTSPALARRAIRLAACRSGMRARLLERDHVEAILGLMAPSMEGRGVDLPGGIRAVRRGEWVVFEGRERGRGPER